MKIKLEKIYLNLLFSSSFLSLIIYFFFPNLYNLVIRENQLVENITTLTYLITFLLGLKYTTKKINAYRGLSTTVTIISLIAFLEEISYGAVFSKFRSFFNIQLITVYDKKIDSFHDILDLAKIGISRTLTENPEFIGFLVLLGILLIVLLVNLFLKIKKRLFKALKKFEIFWISIASITFLTLSILVDLYIVPSSDAPYFEDFIWGLFVEELFEMFVSFGLLIVFLKISRKKVLSNYSYRP